MQNRTKLRVINLRKKGNTYSEIIKKLHIKIPKSTISYWCKNVKLSKEQRYRIVGLIKENFTKNRAKALIVNRKKRKIYLETIEKKYLHLNKLFDNLDIARLSLAILYLTEGANSISGSIMFGNSNPNIIKLFLKLLRKCYDVKEERFRCTLQCRADQNIHQLEQYWSRTTGIHLRQFYKARVDQRTINSKTRNKEYKGVCRIDYFSSNVYNELKTIAEIMYEGL